MKTYSYFILFIAFNFTASAQNDSLFTDLFEVFLEEEIDLTEEEFSDYKDYLDILITDPIDLNTASKKDLLRIPFIDINAAGNILTFREKQGRFFSLNELFLVEGLNNITVRKILPFFKVTAKETVAQINEKPAIELEIRSRYQEKFSPEEINSYPGIPGRTLQRFLLKNKGVGNAGLLFEKDPGELRYADFCSFHIELFPGKIINHLVFGDYFFEFGQGLVLWSPYSSGKGSNISTPFNRSAKHLKASRSSNETAYLRGAAINFDLQNLSLNLFYSARRKDASLNSEGIITSLTTTGYHRTESEESRRNSIGERITGFTIGYKNDFLSTEFLWYKSLYSNSFMPETRYGLRGSNFTFYSLDYKFLWNNILFTGETAYNGLSVATINNLLLPLTRRTEFVLSLRSYPRNFYNLFGAATGEQSDNRNEKGIYTGLKFTSDMGNFSAYYDIFNFPYSSNYSNFSSGGRELLVEYESSVFSGIRIRIKYKYEIKEHGGDIYHESSYNIYSHKLRTAIYYTPDNSLYFRTGFDFIYTDGYVSSSRETGILLHQDVRSEFKNNLSLQLRFIYYSSESYNSRIYHYENDLRGIMTNLPFYGEGYKWYVIVKWRPFKLINFAAKYSIDYRTNNYTVDEKGNKLFGTPTSRIALQIENFL